MTGRLQGKVAVITGTASGQGRAAAVIFAHEGATIVGVDVDVDGSKETVRLVTEAGGRMTSTHPVDLTVDGEVERWLGSVVEEHGRIDVLYANAGAARFSPVAETSFDDWSWVLRHELDLVFLPVKYAWASLIANAGCIIMVGSTAGVTGSMTNTRIAHTATKGGVIAMTKQLAAEGAPHGVRVNCVSPGMILTPQTRGNLLADDSPMRSIAEAIPLGRIGTPDEVAQCALFLASDEASYVTGANLMVDGGWSAVLPG